MKRSEHQRSTEEVRVCPFCCSRGPKWVLLRLIRPSLFLSLPMSSLKSDPVGGSPIPRARAATRSAAHEPKSRTPFAFRPGAGYFADWGQIQNSAAAPRAGPDHLASGRGSRVNRCTNPPSPSFRIWASGSSTQRPLRPIAAPPGAASDDRAGPQAKTSRRSRSCSLNTSISCGLIRSLCRILTGTFCFAGKGSFHFASTAPIIRLTAKRECDIIR
jgi:hypothetical protein